MTATVAPVLDREEYIEQAYFFQTFRERLAENQAAQEVLGRLHEEILSTTRLPLAIQFLATEIKHSGVLGSGFQRLTHYFTPFQAFVVSKAEEEGLRFSMDTALKILEGEAKYRSEKPSPAGLFVYEFEALARNRLGYDDGLTAMAQDSFYDQEWRDYMEMVRRSVGEFEFADLVFVRSELNLREEQKKHPEKVLPRALFGEKEGKIARASRGRDPLFLFSALQRQLGYPEVPRQITRENPLAQLPTILAKLREFEQRVKVLEGDMRERLAPLSVALDKPEQIKPIALDE
jgi:hypothetical protein